MTRIRGPLILVDEGVHDAKCRQAVARYCGGEDAQRSQTMQRTSAPRGDAVKRELKIGEMAALLGTTTKTLRHYESLKLLAPPTRTAGGYRLYDAAALARASLVIGLRRLGLGIPEVASVLRGSPPPAELRHRLAEALDEKIRDADEWLGVLQGRREDLAARQRRLVLGSPDECLCSLVSMPCTCGRSGPGRRP